MGIGHTWHLQLHSLSGKEKGQLINGSSAGWERKLSLKTALIHPSQMYSRDGGGKFPKLLNKGDVGSIGSFKL